MVQSRAHSKVKVNPKKSFSFSSHTKDKKSSVTKQNPKLNLERNLLFLQQSRPQYR